MTQQDKEKLNKFAQLKKDINTLEKQADELKEEVLNIMQMNDLGEVSVGDDKITIGVRRTWKYTPELTQREKELKEEKKMQERIGEATYTEKFFAIFTDSNNKKEYE